ncbi:LON peptidase substrate-binding domain-containing protein [Jiella sp. MQZ9-1]|uniref:LON peptidase substrate-binding domain-containing protein n=1 Tax=Jiella flava TaxID=2816857 RepID=A0A939FUE1_9HYPH|nr:LON peptidase substrate-binding domain-containing protein [Jiella flava]MBO0661620.1 LON peptidase substrate-binding domain-containing protein [Jiella flava]MCD2470262.1 LON peptidase substrate-binding domain-containing protein [Jiella flava]
MVQAGNFYYTDETDLPATIPVFPLSEALLLPSGQLPLNIFEPRYIEMIDDAMAGERLIGMVQPSLDGAMREDGRPKLCEVGCIGRITSFAESGDGRYVISLQGVARFRVVEEMAVRAAYRVCRIAAFLGDLEAGKGADEVDREGLLRAFRHYLNANQMDADWDSIARASNETLVNALSMMSPYGAAEKQALLEANDLKTRAETLVAITEIALARDGGEDGAPTLQ